VVAAGRGGHVSVVALALCLLAALSWGIGNVVSRASGVRGGLSLTVWSAVVVPVPLLALSLALDGPAAVGEALESFSWQAGVSTLYTAGLASLVGYGVFNTLLARNPSSSVVPWVLLAPVVAMASAWLLLGQRPNAAETTGGLLLIAGVLVAMRPRRAGARGSGGRARGPDVGHGAHGVAQLGEPVVLVLADEPDAPGQRVRA
jgi:O-acetylserine/cysteine efflux transporter